MARYSSNDLKIIDVLGFLAMLYPNFELTEATIAAYVRILGDLPADLVEQAAEDIGSRNTFFPAASEIRTAAFELMSGSRGLPTAYEAWSEVIKIISAYSGDRDSRCSHPLIAKTVESVGGWYMIGMSENQVADRARFVQSYDIFVKREMDSMRTLPRVREFEQGLEAGKVKGEVKKLAARLSKNGGRE